MSIRSSKGVPNDGAHSPVHRFASWSAVNRQFSSARRAPGKLFRSNRRNRRSRRPGRIPQRRTVSSVSSVSTVGSFKSARIGQQIYRNGASNTLTPKSEGAQLGR